MDIRHIRHVDGKETRVEYIDNGNGETDERKRTSKQKPETAFTNALAAFEPLVLKWLKLEKAWKEGFSVTGISLSESKAKGGRSRMGIIVVCRYTPEGSTSPMFINTPLLKEALEQAEVNKEGFIPESWSDELARRLADFDIHPSGPLWGAGELRSTSECARIELAAISDDVSLRLRAGLEAAELKQERRALRLKVAELAWEWLGATSLQLSFALPPGTYATAVLHELGTCESPL